MMAWFRRRPRTKLDELTELWHVRTPPARPGLTTGACGTTIVDPADVDVWDPSGSEPGPPDPGDRCPVCSASYGNWSNEDGTITTETTWSLTR